MLYTMNWDKFYADLVKFTTSIQCSEKTACRTLSLNRSFFYRLKNGQGINGDTVAILCYWADLDIRDYIIDEPGQPGKQLSLLHVNKSGGHQSLTDKKEKARL